MSQTNSNRSLQELSNAEIVPNAGGPQAYMVRFGENDYEMLNKSSKHRLILEEGVFDDTPTDQPFVAFNLDGYVVEVDFDYDDIIITSPDADDVRVPPERHENVLWSVYDDDTERLASIHDDLYEPTVRIGLMDNYMPRFRRGDEVQKTDDGWLYDGEILVRWNAENEAVDVGETHIVRSGGTQVASTDREARDVTLPDFDEPVAATTPDGRTIDLDGVEARFLASVALITGNNAGMYDDELSSLIDGGSITAFIDTRSGLHHGHGLQKHTLGQLGVTDAAQSRLWYNSHDHAGVHEMKVRRDEFEDAPIDVFDDAANDDPSKWQKIEDTSKQAPIPSHVRDDLSERYE